MAEIRFKIDISSEEYKAYYAGVARNVIVRSLDGKVVQFPANVLRPYLSHTGVKGLFALEYDENNRFSGIRKIFEGSS